MKKTILKTALICLGITLLCGLCSFRTPERVKSQQSYQIAVIFADTIITPNGEESECIKEVVDRYQDPCTCLLEVRKNGTGWTLYIVYQSCGDNNIDVYAEYTWTEEYPSGSPKTTTRTTAIPLRPGDNPVIFGDYRQSICIPNNINAWACIKDDSNKNK